MKTVLQYRKSRRRGYSLIEMVVVVGAVTTVLSMCGLVLHAIMRLDRSGRRGFDDAATVGRLAQQFRQDVRSASSAEASAASDTKLQLNMKFPDKQTVTYALDGIKLIRTEKQEDGKVLDREGYRVDRIGPVGFETKGSWVRLKLSRASENGTALPKPPIQVEAKLGKDHAFSTLKEVKP